MLEADGTSMSIARRLQTVVWKKVYNNNLPSDGSVVMLSAK